MKHGILIIISLLFLSSCIKTKCEDDALAPLTPYHGSQLRTDGYYYSFIEHNQWDGDIYDAYVFYRNGVILYAGFSGSETFEKREEQFKTDNYYSLIKNTKYAWGEFFVDSYNIQLQTWSPAYCGLPAWSTTGIILNDTTFVLTKKEKLKGGSSSQQNDTFHFKQFCCKPDSTNDFVK